MREAAAEDAREPQLECLAQRQQLLVIRLDELAATLRVLTRGKITNRPHSTAGVLASVEHRDRRASACKFICGREPRQPCPADNHARAVHARLRSNRSATPPIIGA